VNSPAAWMQARGSGPYPMRSPRHQCVGALPPDVGEDAFQGREIPCTSGNDGYLHEETVSSTASLFRGPASFDEAFPV